MGAVKKVVGVRRNEIRLVRERERDKQTLRESTGVTAETEHAMRRRGGGSMGTEREGENNGDVTAVRRRCTAILTGSRAFRSRFGE